MFDPIRENEYGYIFEKNDETQISIYLFSGDDIIKNVDLHYGGITGDFGFKLEVFSMKDYELNTNSFVVEKHNLLYDSFANLLGNQEQLIIDDDFTHAIEVKYLQIKKENEKIILEFHNHKNEMSSIDKFSVGIKNTLRDLRSKIDQQELDTKLRLLDFFNKGFFSLKSYAPDGNENLQVKKLKL